MRQKTINTTELNAVFEENGYFFQLQAVPISWFQLQAFHSFDSDSGTSNQKQTITRHNTTNPQRPNVKKC